MLSILFHLKKEAIEMKKGICLLLSLVMLAAGIACAIADGSVWFCPQCGEEMSPDANFCYRDGTPRPGSGSSSGSSLWPNRVLAGSHTSFARNNNPEYRVQSRSGPGKAYVGVGAYKIKKAKTMKLLFREGGYAYIDMQYPSVGHRCLYVLAGTLSRNSAAQMDLPGIPAETSGTVVPRFGPGNSYDSFDEASIGNGTQVSVFFETDGWLFSEFSCGLGLVRAWLPVGQVNAR
jgi:hypothetical protein